MKRRVHPFSTIFKAWALILVICGGGLSALVISKEVFNMLWPSIAVGVVFSIIAIIVVADTVGYIKELDIKIKQETTKQEAIES